MSTFAEDIETAADGPILGVVIGESGWGNGWGEEGYNEEGKVIDWSMRGRVLDWGWARPLLDYKYGTEYGSPECHSIYAWTETSVIFVAQYDGSTWLNSIPRNPTDCRPTMPGG